MIIVPERFTHSIKQIIEWHLETYVPDVMVDILLKRILERPLCNGMIQLEDKELYSLHECISNATNNIPECGVEENIVWEIYDWVKEEYEKADK